MRGTQVNNLPSLLPARRVTRALRFETRGARQGIYGIDMGVECSKNSSEQFSSGLVGAGLKPARALREGLKSIWACGARRSHWNP